MMKERDANEDSNVAYATETETIARGQVRLKVVSVKVWSNSSQRQESVYAFLDEASDTTLCTENLKDRLHARGKPVSFSFSMISGTGCQSGQ